jgi:hypothetical protein
LDQIGFVRADLPGCLPPNRDVNLCTAGVSPDPANWLCDDFFGAFAVDPCAAQFDALNVCFSQ